MRTDNHNDQGINPAGLDSLKGLSHSRPPGAGRAGLETKPGQRRGNKFLTGFTLVETMVSMAIFLIIFGAVFVVMTKSLDSFYVGSGSVYLEEEGSRAIEEIAWLIGESNVDGVSFPSVADPLTGGTYQMLMLPSGRGTNGQFAGYSTQTATYGEPLWQSVVIYYPYRTTDGIDQLCQYVIYDANFSRGFPFTCSNITSGQMTIRNNTGQLQTIQRNSGRVIINYFNINGNYQIQRLANTKLVTLDLPLRKQVRQISRGADFFLNSDVVGAVTVKSKELEL